MLIFQQVADKVLLAHIAETLQNNALVEAAKVAADL
jgi:hypothetical protein